MAVLPVGFRVERLLDEDQVVVAEAETVKEGRAVLVAARYRGDDLQRPRHTNLGLKRTSSRVQSTNILKVTTLKAILPLKGHLSLEIFIKLIPAEN